MQGTNTERDGARLRLHQLAGEDARASFAADVARGLGARPKRLFPKYFYDELGSRLFEAICLLPEYYLTRAEGEILSRYADEIAATLGDSPAALVEFGSGSAAKTRLLIEALLRRQKELLYAPIDISAAALEAGARALLESYTAVRVEAYAGDYDAALALLRKDAAARRGPTLALFLGSNVGNFDREEAESFLRKVRDVLSAGDQLLLGADLKKDREALEAAYDDSLGVTAAFNLNLLARLNREFDADFRLRDFRHVAIYNEKAGRVELYLESAREQTVRLPALDLEVRFDAGERIHTENSYKYDLTELSALAARAGFARKRTWLDARGWFSSNLFVAVAEGESRVAP